MLEAVVVVVKTERARRLVLQVVVVLEENNHRVVEQEILHPFTGLFMVAVVVLEILNTPVLVALAVQ